MGGERLRSYDAFWRFYLKEHSSRWTRRLHVLGTIGGIAVVVAGVLCGSGVMIAGGVILAYGLAWIAHFFIEHNRPATFRYPLWSLRADFHMVALALTARLEAEIARQSGQSGPDRD